MRDPTDRSMGCYQGRGDGGSGDPKMPVRGRETRAQRREIATRQTGLWGVARQGRGEGGSGDPKMPVRVGHPRTARKCRPDRQVYGVLRRQGRGDGGSGDPKMPVRGRRPAHGAAFRCGVRETRARATCAQRRAGGPLSPFAPAKGRLTILC